MPLNKQKEIEIYKTKSRITKSLINQMVVCNADIFLDGLVLGHVVNVVQNSPISFLIVYDKKYYTFPFGYKKYSGGLERRIGKILYYSSLDQKRANKFWPTYKEAKKKSVQIYI